MDTTVTFTPGNLPSVEADGLDAVRAYWTALLSIRPADLRVGDVVVTDGMRVLIDQPVTERAGCGGVTVWSTPGRVLNEDEAVEVCGIPRSWFRRDHYIDGEGWTPDATDVPRWTIQGTDLFGLRIEPRA